MTSLHSDSSSSTAAAITSMATAAVVAAAVANNPVELAYAVAALQRHQQQQQQQQQQQHARPENANSAFHSVPSSTGALESSFPPQLASSATKLGDDVQAHSEHENEEDDDDDDAEKRLERSRARNREHARRTRLRKKAQLEGLQSKVKVLEAERQTLKQQIEECSIASILLGLSHSSSNKNIEEAAAQDMLDTEDCDTTKQDAKATKVALLAGGKRKRFLTSALQNAAEDSDGSGSVAQLNAEPLKVCIDGVTTVIGGGKSHINWKTGVYSDEKGVQKQLTTVQLETLRRERNRRHAKMTRDRKKCFIATIEKTIEDLEADIQRMKDILSRVSGLGGNSNDNMDNHTITPGTSPKLQALPSPGDAVEEDDVSSLHGPAARAAKRARHGFALQG